MEEKINIFQTYDGVTLRSGIDKSYYIPQFKGTSIEVFESFYNKMCNDKDYHYVNNQGFGDGTYFYDHKAAICYLEAVGIIYFNRIYNRSKYIKFKDNDNKTQIKEEKSVNVIGFTIQEIEKAGLTLFGEDEVTDLIKLLETNKSQNNTVSDPKLSIKESNFTPLLDSSIKKYSRKLYKPSNYTIDTNHNNPYTF